MTQNENRHIAGAHSVKSFVRLTRDAGLFYKYADQMTDCQLTEVELFLNEALRQYKNPRI